MENTIRNGILRGRPLSMQHIHDNLELCKFKTHINCDERYIINVLQNIFNFNVSLLSVVSLRDECRLVELLTAIQNALDV